MSGCDNNVTRYLWHDVAFMIQCDKTRHNGTRHDVTGQDTMWPDMMWQDRIWQDMTGQRTGLRQ